MAKKNYYWRFYLLSRRCIGHKLGIISHRSRLVAVFFCGWKKRLKKGLLMYTRVGGRIYHKSGKFWYYKDRNVYRKAGATRSLFLNAKMKYDILNRAARKDDNLVCLLIVGAVMVGLIILVPVL